MPDIARQPMLNTFQCHKLEHWKDYVNHRFPPLEMRTSCRQDFRADVSYQRFGQIDFAYIDSSALTIERTPVLARRSETAYIKILWQVSGEMEVEQDEQSCLLRRGDISICDTSRKYRLRTGDGSRHAVLMLPHEIDPRLARAARERCATFLTEESAYQAALGAILGLINQSNHGPLRDTDAVLGIIGDMLVNTLVSRHDCHCDGRDRLEAARRYIEEHMADRELTPEQLASGLNMSRRSLYHCLARHGTTPARMVTDMRLNQARIRLEQTGKRERVIDIAHASGFRDSAQFSRAFKRRFGKSPSRWRPLPN